MNGALHVAPATRADLDAVHALEHKAFTQDRLSRRAIKSFIDAPHRPLHVAKVADALAGYAVLALRSNSRIARLYSVAVDPAFGRRGIGRALLAAVEAYGAKRGCAALRLEVRKDNAAAIALYEGRGYRPFGEYADYYEDGAPALRMEKALSQGAL